MKYIVHLNSCLFLVSRVPCLIILSIYISTKWLRWEKASSRSWLSLCHAYLSSCPKHVTLLILLLIKALVGWKSLYIIKTFYDESIEGYKARLVAKEFTKKMVLSMKKDFPLLHALSMFEHLALQPLSNGDSLIWIWMLKMYFSMAS